MRFDPTGVRLKLPVEIRGRMELSEFNGTNYSLAELRALGEALVRLADRLETVH